VASPSVDAGRADDRDVIWAGICFALADEVGDVLCLDISGDCEAFFAQFRTGHSDEALVVCLVVVVRSVGGEQVGDAALQSLQEWF